MAVATEAEGGRLTREQETFSGMRLLYRAVAASRRDRNDRPHSHAARVAHECPRSPAVRRMLPRPDRRPGPQRSGVPLANDTDRSIVIDEREVAGVRHCMLAKPRSLPWANCPGERDSRA